MPSIFSRARTNSTPKAHNSLAVSNKDLPPLDEFGRVRSRTPGPGAQSLPISKVDKKSKKDRDNGNGTTGGGKTDLRLRTTANGGGLTLSGVGPPGSALDLHSPLLFPDGTFLPLVLENPIEDISHKDQDYGFLSSDRHVVLGLEQVARLADVIVAELGTRGGLTTPFIFSSAAIDLSYPAVRRMTHAFVATCADPSSQEAERKWRDEAKFAGPHELGMCLRWGLARVVRVSNGLEVRGLLSWEQYTRFRDSEAALEYPPAHFSTFIPELQPALRSIVLNVLSLLTRLTAHSASSGHTPPTLSPLFGPLLFGLGPATLSFHHCYIYYLRAVNATEHLLLAFIRWQDSPRPAFSSSNNGATSQGSAQALGVPTRLKDWIRGYPAMLPFLKDRKKLGDKKPEPRRGVRTVRVMSVRRNVRMYTHDLVKSAASWAQRPRPGAALNEMSLVLSKDWERIAPQTLNLPPRYSDQYKKRMNLLQNFHPDQGSNAANASTTSSASSSTLVEDKDPFGLGKGLSFGSEERFRSLTDLKWGEFESMGFSNLGDEKKLQFDLTESARTARAQKRSTLSWNDFSDSGFSRSDEPLNATLQFSTPIINTVSAWPSSQAEMTRKLKKTQRALPAFGWDTEPIMGQEDIIEEAFLDVFCDLIYGGGWMDLERAEDIDREVNWALVEFKSMPNARSVVPRGQDPRTGNTLLLFEEFVPAEYRQQLAQGSTSRRKLPSLFSSSGKSKQWKPATTLNGRPYVIGQTPQVTSSYREVEFDELLNGTAPTKVLTLQSKPTTYNDPKLRISTMTMTPNKTDPLPARASEGDAYSDTTASPDKTKRASRFRLSGSQGNKPAMIPAEYSSVDFHTRVATGAASDDEDEDTGGRNGSNYGKPRATDDDSWMEILVGNSAKRMADQSATFSPKPPRGAKRDPEMDPDMASREVEAALANLKNEPFSDAEDDVMEPVDAIDEVEYVPRRKIEGLPPIHTPEEEVATEDPASQGSLSNRQQAKMNRRLGYFDLHPERRPASMSEGSPDEGSHLPPASPLSHEGSEIDVPAFSQPPQPIHDSKASKVDSFSIPRVTPPSLTPLPQIPIAPLSPVRAPLPPTPVATPAAPAPAPAPAPSSSKAAEKAPAGGVSKTAALIEMYRQKEQPAPAKPSLPSPPQPSRLPIRSLPLPPNPTPQPSPSVAETHRCTCTFSPR